MYSSYIRYQRSQTDVTYTNQVLHEVFPVVSYRQSVRVTKVIGVQGQVHRDGSIAKLQTVLEGKVQII